MSALKYLLLYLLQAYVISAEQCQFTDWFSYYRVYLVRPDEYKTCLEQASMDSNNMIQTIQATRDIFARYYAFYDVAANPLATNPRNVQTQFGQSIYNSTESGKVNITQKIDELISDVQSNGANLTTFWSLNEIFWDLYDAHVTIKMPYSGFDSDFGPGGQYIWGMIPDSIRNSTYDKLITQLYFSDGVGKVKMNFTKNGAITTKNVKTIDGKDAFQYMVEMADNPQISGAFKSAGPRINDVAKKLLKHSPLIVEVLGSSDPVKTFPQEVNFVYSDDTQEKFTPYVGIESHSIDITTLTATAQESGTLYSAVKAAINEAELPFFQRSISPPAQQIPPISAEGFTVISSDGNYIIGYKVTAKYLVLKISSFNILNNAVETMITAWKKILDVAESNNLKKLIIDISSNGGGTITAGYALAQCMFPDASFEDFKNPYNVPFSDSMKVFKDDVLPELDRISKLNSTAEEFLYDSLLNDSLKMNLTESIPRAIYALISQIESGPDGRGIINNARDLLAAAEKFLKDSSLDNFREITNEIHALLSDTNPWSETTFSLDEIPSKSPQAANRGGISREFTPDFEMFPRALYDFVKEKVSKKHFTEYLLVSDGCSGSTANTFSTTVEQISNNLDNLGASLKSVFYGGTGNKYDGAITQFAGGSVRTPRLSGDYVTLGSLFLFKNILEGTPYEGNITTVFTLFNESRLEAPFYVNKMPAMPAVQVFNKFMGSGAMPLEYVYFPPKEYIKQFFTRITFDDGSDLPALYDEAAKFFTYDPAPQPGAGYRLEFGVMNVLLLPAIASLLILW